MKEVGLAERCVCIYMVDIHGRYIYVRLLVMVT